MNMRIVFYLVLSLVIASCTSNKDLQEKLAFIDVTKEYPEKKIELTDIADVSICTSIRKMMIISIKAALIM